MMKKLFLGASALAFLTIASPVMAQTCNFEYAGGQYSLRKQGDGSYSGTWTEHSTRRSTNARYIRGQVTYSRFSGGQATIKVGNKCA